MLLGMRFKGPLCPVEESARPPPSRGERQVPLAAGCERHLECGGPGGWGRARYHRGTVETKKEASY